MQQRLFRLLVPFFLFNISYAQQPKLVLPVGNYILTACLNNDGGQLATVSKDNKLKTWNLSDFKLDKEFYDPDLAKSFNCNFSGTGKYLAVSCTNFITKVFDITNGKFLYNLDGWVQDLNSLAFSPDEKFIITSHISGGKAVVWDLASGKRIFELQNKSNINYGIYSPDGKYIFTGSAAGDFIIWNAAGTDTIGRGTQTGSGVFCALFDKISEHIFVGYMNGEVLLYDLRKSSLLMKAKGHTARINDICVSNDDRFFASASSDNTIKIWESNTGKLYSVIKTHTESVLRIMFGQNDSTIISTSNDQALKKTNFINHTTPVNRKINQGFGAFSQKADRLITCNDDKIDLYSYPSLNLIYSILPLDNNQHLVIDSSGRYDGAEAARNQIHFTCGNEIINLAQVKDQLWIPNLAERIMKGESINAKTLEELNICGLTPEVEDASSKDDEYYFNITPRRGGLGETVLYVNGIEAKHYKPAQLQKTGSGYQLRLKKEEIKKFFITGKENMVTIKAATADNTISSRGLIIKEDKTKEATTPPNLYAVMVGISDYKGDELDLKFAAKDATDISTAVANAAKKMLNTDGREHVFMYNLTTAKEHFQLPEKNSIKKVLEEIGKKATANDILLIFFAGHGVMEGDKKQFYFLTADASKTSAASAVADVGISTAELTEWMKPQHIKAQKRILIFDACNSGQAIKDFVKMGNKDQGYLAARNDDKAQQIKAIDKLNEKSGLFILSASASNQSAYEMGRYSQGLLTYSLLKAIKQQPDILEEGKYLNLSRWFDAAEKTVSELSKENGARQEPQIVTNTNFNIGVVDEEVMAKIILSTEKPLFAASNFQNADENITDDNLELSRIINGQLAETSSRGTDSKIIYVTATNSPDAYLLIGRYDVKGEDLTVKVNIKQGREIKFRFEVKGRIDSIKGLAEMVVQQATEWIMKNK